jgi:ribosomal protein S18 acetylase RimI-like enzyme
VVIRFFREVDYEPVSKLLNEAYRNPTRLAHLTPDRLRREFANRGNNPHENCVVLESPQGDVVGFCGYDPLPDGRALLDGPLLRQEFRRQGWGHRLWQEISNLARARGIRTISAVLSDENEAAESFLDALGFRTEKTDVIMVCESRPARPPAEAPEGVTVERAGDELDLADYEDLHARLFTRRSLAYLGLLARSPDYHILLARRGPELVGHLELEQLEDVATIEAFGVAPEARRQGIGKALLACALQFAWQLPAVRLVRQIWKADDSGYFKVYLDLGFQRKCSIRSLVRHLSDGPA